MTAVESEMRKLITSSQSLMASNGASLVGEFSRTAIPLTEAHQAFTMELFDQLPDGNQELFIESWRNTSSFHSFQKLPLELRLIIWRLTFPEPRREISIGTPRLKEAQLDTKYLHTRRKRDPMPNALYISAESRRVALKHYCVVLRNEMRPFRVRPLFFDPIRDELKISFSDLDSISHRLTMSQTVSERSGHGDSGNNQYARRLQYFNKVSTLTLDFASVHDFVWFYRNWEWRYGEGLINGAFMFCFTALRELRLRFNRLNVTTVKKALENMREFLEKHKMKLPSIRAPLMIERESVGQRRA